MLRIVQRKLQLERGTEDSICLQIIKSKLQSAAKRDELFWSVKTVRVGCVIIVKEQIINNTSNHRGNKKEGQWSQ